MVDASSERGRILAERWTVAALTRMPLAGVKLEIHENYCEPFATAGNAGRRRAGASFEVPFMTRQASLGSHHHPKVREVRNIDKDCGGLM